MRAIFLTILLLVLTFPAEAQNLSVEIAREHIDVSVGFNGSMIEVFGDRRDAETDVAVFVIGPEKTVTVWQRAQILGAWVNRHFVHFSRQPGYYHYAASFDAAKGPEYAALMRENRIGVEALFEGADIRASRGVEDKAPFQSALILTKQNKGIYPQKPAALKFMNEHFFRVNFPIPPGAPIGEYKVHSFLIKKGAVIEADIDIVKVEQVGVNASVLYMSRHYALLYAMLCIMLAGFAGWLVNVVRVRP